MKIAVNLLPYVDYQGIETFAINLLVAYAERFPEDDLVLIKHSLSPGFFSVPLPNVSEIIIPVQKRNKGALAFLQQTKLYGILKEIKPDAFFAISPIAPVFYGKTVMTIHDCAYDRFAEFANLASKWYFKIMYYVGKYRAKAVVTDSEYSKKELMDLYGVPAEKIFIVHLATPQLPRVDEDEATALRKKWNLERPYFLYVGNTRPRKNVDGLLKAFAEFKKNHREYVLVLAGKIDTRFLDVAAMTKQLGISDSVIQTGFISDEEKVALYKGAHALAFPSFYEGFGLPVLEANEIGVPVITSHTSSLPEVAGDAAIYIDPRDVHSIVDAMEYISSDPALRNDLIKKGYMNVKRFSWRSAAEELHEAFSFSIRA